MEYQRFSRIYEVYHKRESSQRWKGPSRVLFLRHGTGNTNAHICYVQPVKLLTCETKALQGHQ